VTIDLIIPTIVEGHGEVRALPVIIRRLLSLLVPQLICKIPEPIRVPKGSLLNRPDERSRALNLAAIKGTAAPAWFILIVLDSDGECPAESAPLLLSQCREARGDCRLALTFAHREFEAWFIAAAESLRGYRGLPKDLVRPSDPESIQDAKGWIKELRAERAYSPTVDQAAFASNFSLDEARIHAPSFDKFCRDLTDMLRSSGFEIEKS
jgi:hypothetical protein